MHLQEANFECGWLVGRYVYLVSMLKEKKEKKERGKERKKGRKEARKKEIILVLCPTEPPVSTFRNAA